MSAQKNVIRWIAPMVRLKQCVLLRFQTCRGNKRATVPQRPEFTSVACNLRYIPGYKWDPLGFQLLIPIFSDDNRSVAASKQG